MAQGSDQEKLEALLAVLILFAYQIKVDAPSLCERLKTMDERPVDTP